MMKVNDEIVSRNHALYAELLCDNCKSEIVRLTVPVKLRMDKGQTPKLSDVVKLQRCVCASCTAKIAIRAREDKELREQKERAERLKKYGGV